MTDLDAKAIQEDNERLKLENKKLQCCGNCKKYRMPESQVPLRCLKNRVAYSCCEDWEMYEDVTAEVTAWCELPKLEVE